MTISSLSTRAKAIIASLLLCVLVAVPLLSSAATLFEDIQALQQQIQVIRDAVEDADGPGAPTFEEKQKMLSDLSSLETSLATLQLAIGDNSKIRTNISSLYITGDIRTFTAEATIMYDEEIINGVTEPAASTTYNYSFTPMVPASDVKGRARELRTNVLKALATDTGLPLSMVKDEAVLSFQKFSDKDDVVAFTGYKYPPNTSIYGDFGDPADDLIDMFGRYSLITGIVFKTGDFDTGSVEVTLTSNQNEVLLIRVGPPCKMNEGGKVCGSGFVYTLTYFVMGSPVIVVDSPVSTPNNIFNFLANILADTDVWKVYGTEAAATSTVASAPDGETAVAAHITSYLTQQKTYFKQNAGQIKRPTDGLNKCTPPRVKASVIALMEFFIVGRLQLAAPLYQLSNWYVPVVYEREANTQCFDVQNEFFPDLPVVDWEAAIIEGDRDPDEAWFLQ